MLKKKINDPILRWRKMKGFKTCRLPRVILHLKVQTSESQLTFYPLEGPRSESPTMTHPLSSGPRTPGSLILRASLNVSLSRKNSITQRNKSKMEHNRNL